MFNYDVIKAEDGRYQVVRLSLPYDVVVATVSERGVAEDMAELLRRETTESHQVSRNEALLDIRRLFLGDARLGIDISALPHVAAAKEAKDIAITIALQEMTAIIKECL